MAIIIKALGANTIGVTGTADLYTVPPNKSAVVYNIRLVNGTDATTHQINAFVKPSSAAQSARRIYKKDYPFVGKASLILEDVLTLGVGDKIQLSVGNGVPSLGYTVNGIERDE